MRKIYFLMASAMLAFGSVRAQNNALSFSGGNEYVSLPINTSLDVAGSSLFSVAAWVNPIGGSAPVYTKWRSNDTPAQISFDVKSNKLMLGFDVFSGAGWQTVTSALSVPNGKWTHVAFTLEGGVAKIYVNGVLDGTLTLDAAHLAAVPSTGATTLGGNGILDSKGAQLLDEVSLWGKALTADEIVSLMKTPLAGIETGLIACYDFNQGTPNGNNNGYTSLLDASLNLFHGSLQGFALTGKTSNWVSGKYNRYYVAPVAKGAADATSWANASSNLAQVLDGTVFGDTVWVAAGTFKPTSGTDKSVSFNIRDGVNVMGGFAGTETKLLERNIVANKTVLSGNIGNEALETDNSRMVVNMAGLKKGVCLDGVTVTGGYSSIANMTVTVPSSLAGTYICGNAVFGPQQFSVSGDVVVAEPLNALGGITNDVTGKIVLIQRGELTFEQKALNAQTAGAVGVIIYNNADGAINSMGDVPEVEGVTIPVVSLSLADGTAVKDAVALGAVSVLLQQWGALVPGSAINITGMQSSVKNCTITQNTSINGAVLNSEIVSSVFEGCEFSDNTSTNGGAVFTQEGNVIFNKCSFLNNNCSKQGGAVYCNRALSTINSCTFNGNIAYAEGGAIYAEATDLILTDSKLVSNASVIGGGLICRGAMSKVNITGSQFVDNGANNAGGGALFSADVVVNLSGSAFINNVSDDGNGYGSGAGIQLNSASTLVNATNCLFVGNNAKGSNDDGGAAAMVYLGQLSMYNCTLVNNISATKGGGVHVYDLNGSATLENCIVWGNTAGTAGSEGIYSVGGTLAVNYSDVQGSEVFAGTGNLNVDPLFADAADVDGADDLLFTADDGLGIQSSSPVVNLGNSATVTPSSDIAHALRVGRFDMGAYEAPLATAVPVRPETKGLRMFPNPAVDVVALSCADGVENVTITDLAGKAFWSGDASAFPLNVAPFGQGVYLVKISTANGVMTEKLIVGSAR